MTNNNNVKRTLISGFLAMILCNIMFIGSTYAWFATSVSNKNNQIETGDLEIGLYQVESVDGTVTETPVTEETKFFSDAKWEPGAVYYEEFHVKNEGSLSLKYELALKWSAFNFIKKSDDAESGPSLTDVLQIAMVPGSIEATTNKDEVLVKLQMAGTRVEDVINAGETADVLTVIVYWPSTENDSTYNVNTGSVLSDGASVLYADLGIVLEATQLNATQEGNSNEE